MKCTVLVGSLMATALAFAPRTCPAGPVAVRGGTALKAKYTDANGAVSASWGFLVSRGLVRAASPPLFGVDLMPLRACRRPDQVGAERVHALLPGAALLAHS